MSRARMGFILATGCLGILTLGACAHQGQRPTPDNGAALETAARAADRLDAAAERSASALQTLAMIERTRLTPSPSRVEEALLASELRQPITMGWVGPAPEAVRSVARLVGYRFVESGARPSVPTMVTINVEGVSAGQVLADLGLQVQGVGTVLVSQRTRTVEYRHGRVLPAQRVAASAAAHPARETAR